MVQTFADLKMEDVPRPTYPKDYKEREPEEPCEFFLWVDISRPYKFYRWTEAGAVNTQVRVPILWERDLIRAYWHADYVGLPRPEDARAITPFLQLELWAEVTWKPLFIVDRAVPIVDSILTIKYHQIWPFSSVMIKFNCTSMRQLLGLEPNGSGVNGEVAIASSNFNWEFNEAFPFKTRWRAADCITEYESPGGSPAEFIVECETSAIPLGERLMFRLEFVPDRLTAKVVLSVKYTTPDILETKMTAICEVPIQLSNGLDIWYKSKDGKKLASFIVPVPTFIMGQYKKHQNMLFGLDRNEYQHLMSKCFGYNPTTAPNAECDCRDCGLK